MNKLERLPRASADSAAAASAAFSPRDSGRPLYTALAARLPEEPELVDIVSHGLAAYPALHLFNCVHYLLLRDPNDPLAQYYATLTDSPAPPEEAFPEFARFCKTHRDDILYLLRTRTIQATTEERCKMIMPTLSHVADMIGEPLDLIEIGCSAGILLTFDQYAYDLNGRGRLGPEGAPLTLSLDVQGGPQLHIPKIGKRIGLDLRTIDVRSEDERRWILAHCPPEWRDLQARLASALDIVARTEIRFFEGDALDFLPKLIVESPGPLCIYHSACIVYWSDEAKAALEALLLSASHGREIFRVGMEPDRQDVWPTKPFMDIVIARYRDGTVDSKVAAQIPNSFGRDTSLFTWLD